MSDLHVLPLRGRDMPYTSLAPVMPLRRKAQPALVRLYVKARVYRVPGYGWVWSHRCDHEVTKVSPMGLPTHGAAFSRAWNHMRRCC